MKGATPPRRGGPAARAGRRAWVAALGLLIAPAARAWDLRVVPEEGELRAGWPGSILVAVVDDQGAPVTEGVALTTDGGPVTRSTAPSPPGVTAWTVVPVAARDSLGVTVSWGGRSRTQRVPVVSPRPSRLSIDDGLVADAQRGEVSVLVHGEDLPPPDQLAVVVSEGRVARIVPILLGLRVDIATDPSPYPRVLSLGVRDARSTEQPAWGTVTLQSHLPLVVETEPDAQVSVRVGDRVYGPVVVGARGSARVPIDQLPGDTEAEITVRDPLGNEGSQTRPLPTLAAPRVLALAAGTRTGSLPPPPLFVHAVEALGGAWRGEAPVCRTPGIGALSVLPLRRDTWVAPVPVVGGQGALDVRVRCSLGSEAQVDLAIPATPGVPVRLELRMWPEVLSADFPVADLAVSLLDGEGERLPFFGDVDVEATFGQVWLDRGDGPILRGEFQGDVAVEVGEGEITAAWRAPAGAGLPARFVVAPVRIPAVGVADVHVRALDALQRPLVGIDVEVDAGAGPAVGVADDRGWARVALPVPQGGGPIELRLRAGGREARSVIVRGVWPDRAAAAADLVAVVPVRVDPGRVATVEIELDPPVVDAGPGAHTQVTARFLDRSGNLATSALPTVTSTEGNLRPAPFGTDGASRWEIDLLPGFRERRVTVTARSEILDVEESAEVLVRPRPVRATIGATGGLQTNFSSLVAPSLSLDVTGLVRFRPQATVARPSRTRLFAFGSAAWYRADGQEATDVGATGTIRMHLLPVTGGLAVRQEYPAQAFWFGLGIQVVPFWGTLDFGLEQPWASSGGVLSPALAGVLGYGVRVPGGELVVELRGSSATSPGGSTSLSGYVGGLSAMFGYRWIIPATRRRE